MFGALMMEDSLGIKAEENSSSEENQRIENTFETATRIYVGIFSLDTALSHTEPRSEDLKTQIQAAILSPMYCDLSHSFHPYSDPQAYTDLNRGVLYITTLLICSMRQKLYFIPLKYCFLPMKIPLYIAAVGEGCHYIGVYHKLPFSNGSQGRIHTEAVVLHTIVH